jgi:hypothetical protein
LYLLVGESHQSLFQLRVFWAVFWPVILSAVAAIRNKKWYWFLYLDSFLTAIGGIIAAVLLIAGMINT